MTDSELLQARALLLKWQHFCTSHNNCSGCPYWNAHDSRLCIIKYITDLNKHTDEKRH